MPGSSGFPHPQRLTRNAFLANKRAPTLISSAMQDTLTPSSAKTIRNIQRDFPEWHLGRPHYLLWALDVDLEPVRQRVAAAQNHLSARLLDGYVREPHITLSLCGFPSVAPRQLDDFGADLLHRQIDALHRLRPQAFTIAIGALDGFSSAPYLSVADSGGHIERLRASLDLCPHPLARTDYRPHVTIGLYAHAWPLAEIEAELAGFAPGAPLRVEVSRLSLFAYVSAQIGGSLIRVADYEFGQGQGRSICHRTGILPFALP